MAKRHEPAPARARGELTHVSEINLPGVSEDETFVAQAGQAVITFLRGLAGFFTTAQALESEALAKLNAAKDWQPPATSDDDVFIQEQIKDANRLRKEINDWWKITSLVSQFHKRLTGRRDKGANAAEEIANIGNRLHNGWTSAERARVQRALDAERAQAELDAQAKRERELMEFERAAIAAEEKMAGLSQRETLFVDAMVAGVESATAARRAGFKNDLDSAARLLKTPKIVKAIEAGRSARSIRQQAAARAEAPLDVQAPARMTPDIQKAAGAHDRTTKTLEIIDEDAFLEAAFSGRYGIPHNLFTVKQSACNEAARSMGKLVNRWPGVRLKEDTKVV